jgi:hypothetical protein
MSRRVWPCAWALILSCSFSLAEEVTKPAPAPTAKTTKPKRDAAEAKEKAAAALPCARATYKDDPICFGEGDKDALPVPSGATTAQERPSDGLRVKPTANLNARPVGFGPYQAGVVYQSNGNAVTNNFGGGMKVELPF